MKIRDERCYEEYHAKQRVAERDLTQARISWRKKRYCTVHIQTSKYVTSPLTI